MQSRTSNKNKGFLQTRNDLELENFQLLRSANYNPFKDLNVISPQSIKQRFKKTFEVFAGKTAWTSPNFAFLPKKSQFGLFSLILGLPVHLIYSIIPFFLLGIGRIGVELIDLSLDRNAKRLTRLAMSPLLLVGLALTAVGFVGYVVGKSTLYPINWLVQRLVVPGLSGLAVGVVALHVGLVHLLLNRVFSPTSPEPRLPNSSSNSYVDNTLNAQPPPQRQEFMRAQEATREAQEKLNGPTTNLGNRPTPANTDHSRQVQVESLVGKSNQLQQNSQDFLEATKSFRRRGGI
jgi:hypothetical protein